MTKEKITSDHVRAALVSRYPKESHALMFEVAPSTGAGRVRYADAVSVGLWPSHGHKIEGFEIKVSRSDLLSELKKPEKSEPVMKFCHHWWLACPKGIAKVDEIPPNWGLLELQENGQLRVKTQAKILEPVPVDVGFFASIIRRSEPDNAVIDLIVNNRVELAYKQIKKEFESKKFIDTSHKQQMAIDAVKRIERLKSLTGIDLFNYRFNEEFFKSVEVFHELRSEYGKKSLDRVRNILGSALKAINEIPNEFFHEKE